MPIGGVPLVVRVAERVAKIDAIDHLVVATDSPEILETVAAAGFSAILTDSEHRSGTDRVAQVAGVPDFLGYDIVINIQGDEPFIPTEAVLGAIGMVRSGFDIGSAASPLDWTMAQDESLVKVVTDKLGKALYFSRGPVPFARAGLAAEKVSYWQHLGVYAFTRESLVGWTSRDVGELEQVEDLEQLRALEGGLTIGIAKIAVAAPLGVNTLEDLHLARLRWEQELGESV